MLGAPTRFTAHCRMYAAIRDIGRPVEIKELSVITHLSQPYAWLVARELHRCGLIHVAGWRAVTIGGGYPAKLWAFGYGVDVPKPAAKDVAESRRKSYHKRKKDITNAYGYDVWKRIEISRARGGSDRIVVDGRIIYQRVKPAIKNEE